MRGSTKCAIGPLHVQHLDTRTEAQMHRGFMQELGCRGLAAMVCCPAATLLQPCALVRSSLREQASPPRFVDVSGRDKCMACGNLPTSTLSRSLFNPILAMGLVPSSGKAAAPRPEWDHGFQQVAAASAGLPRGEIASYPTTSALQRHRCFSAKAPSGGRAAVSRMGCQNGFPRFLLGLETASY